MARGGTWAPPSAEVARLVSRGAAELLEHPAALVAELESATLAANTGLISLEERFTVAVRAATWANVGHWLRATARDPGEPVGANTGPENLDLARDVVRHGLQDTIAVGFRAAQDVALRGWITLAFDLTDDVVVLRELLDHVARSIQAYVGDTLAAIAELVRRERDQLGDAVHAARLEVVELLLQGSPVSVERAGRVLQRDLDREHLAAVVWCDGAGRLEPARVGEALARASRTGRALTLPVSSTTSWVWVSGRSLPGTEHVVRALDEDEDVGPLLGADGTRVALGAPGPGVPGFRRSHQEAATTQRLARRLPTRPSVTAYEHVEVLALTTGDGDRAAAFVARTLGDLADAPAELREGLRVYLQEQSSATRAARALFSHRNTVALRVERAVALLPHGLRGRTLAVALALELRQGWVPTVRW